MVICSSVDFGQALGWCSLHRRAPLLQAQEIDKQGIEILALDHTFSQSGDLGQWDNLPIHPIFSMLRMRAPF
jgi:hypothetical protein